MDTSHSFRKEALRAITEHDNCPVVTPVQLADALCWLYAQIRSTLAPASVEREWNTITALQRSYNISNYAVRKIIQEGHVRSKKTTGGRVRYNTRDFALAYQKNAF